MKYFNTISENIKKQFAQNRPFVMFCKPGQSKVTAILQRDDTLYFTNDFDESGFIFAPFDGNRYLLIPENQSDVVFADLAMANETVPEIFPSVENPTKKLDFENLVTKGIEAINEGRFGKVVLSRKEMVEVPDFDFIKVFEKLLHAYPNAFRYCWFHPETGLWMGATPERLLKAKGLQFSTVALAGTQKFHDSEQVAWHEKEKDEQRFVTDFIADSLKDKVSDISFSEPYTARAGNLLHIKTDIEGSLHEGSGLRQIIEILHPTPAVCGLPKADAKKFILENEGYDREYYSGFLGELNKNFAHDKTGSDLYVNLRCMKIVENTAHLYVGCGITKDSIPENEFTETANKAMTMKKVLL